MRRSSHFAMTVQNPETKGSSGTILIQLLHLINRRKWPCLLAVVWFLNLLKPENEKEKGELAVAREVLSLRSALLICIIIFTSFNAVSLERSAWRRSLLHGWLHPFRIRWYTRAWIAVGPISRHESPRVLPKHPLISANRPFSPFKPLLSTPPR